MRLTNKDERVAIYGDIQCDTHDSRAIDLACKIFKDFEPTIAINIGDAINMDAVSHYIGDPRRKLRLQKELDVYFDVQSQINEATGEARRIYIKGNHGKRLERALQANLPGLTPLRILKLPSVLRLNELDMEYEEDNVYLGSVQFIHGWVARKWSGTSPRFALESIGYTNSIVQGHSHRQSIISKATTRGPVFGVEIGHLSDPTKMDYLSSPPDWQKGIALLEWKNNRPSFEIVPFFGKVKQTAIWRGRSYHA